jgi:hypothetical protein
MPPRPLFETVRDLAAQSDVIRRRRYGVIEMVEGRLESIRLRPWPKLVTLADVEFWGRRFHDRRQGNRCLLYYNQPRWHSNFLALKYVLSTRDCTLATFHGALVVLDEIARIKRTDAILCDAWNWRISDRLLARWGWAAHKPSRWHRHYIKRFYGEYPIAARAESRSLSSCKEQVARTMA